MLKHKVHEVSLDSGLKGLIIDTPKTGVVAAEVSFRAGEFLLPDEKWETAHLMEHILLGANKHYKKARDFQAAIEQNGATHNASTSVYDITYEAEAADFEWQRVLGLLFDGISSPLFLQEEFDAEFSSVREELISRSNNHFRHLSLALRQAMGLRSLTDNERLELMQSVTREDLRKHYAETHTLANARFIIAGNFNGDYKEVTELLESRLKLPESDRRILMPDEMPASPGQALVIRKPSVPNVFMYLDMYAGRLFDQADMAALHVISTMLTDTWDSRIFGTGRERGIVYHTASGADRVGSASGWWIGAQVSKSNSEAFMRLIRDECLRLKHGKIDQREFDAAKQHLLGRTMRSGQTAGSLLQAYARYYQNDEAPEINKLTQTLKSVTPARCIRVFNEIIDANAWALGVLGSTSVKPAGKLHDYASEIFTQEN